MAAILNTNVIIEVQMVANILKPILFKKLCMHQYLVGELSWLDFAIFRQNLCSVTAQIFVNWCIIEYKEMKVVFCFEVVTDVKYWFC